MDEQLWIFIDDRGLSRAIRENWIPHISADLVWLTESSPDDEVDFANGIVPVLDLSPADIAALSIEEADAPGHILAIFDSLENLVEAAGYGLQPRRVTIVSHQTEGGERIAPSVAFSQRDLNYIRRLTAKGYRFYIQALPNVTARPWPSPSDLRLFDTYRSES